MLHGNEVLCRNSFREIAAIRESRIAASSARADLEGYRRLCDIYVFRDAPHPLAQSAKSRPRLFLIESVARFYT